MSASKNTYIGGMDKDISNNKLPNNKYNNAKNIKVVTQGGESTTAVETEKGTILSFKFPTTQNIYRISRKDLTIDPATSQNSITITWGIPTGTTTITLPYPSVSWPNAPLTNLNIYDFLIDQSTIQSQIALGYFNIYLSDGSEWVYIVGLDSSLTVNITGTDLIIEEVVAEQENLKLNGATHIRDKIILFTTNETSETPTGSASQVWIIKYDEYTDKVIDINSSTNELIPSKHLIYNNKFNLSTAHRMDNPIGRYESDTLQRVYFTDYYNEISKINIADPNLFTTDPGLLNLIPNTKLNQPITQSIGVGTVKVGSVVQYGYRLLNGTTGNETVMSPLSRPVVLTQVNSQNATAGAYNASLDGFSGVPIADVFRGDTSGNSTAARSITWEVNNIDPGFEVIEHIVVYWGTLNVPTIIKFKEQFVPTSGSLTVTYDGTELETLLLTAFEFNQLKGGFYAKTITYKFDRLLAGNIKEKRFEIEYDARAYRSKENEVAFTLEDATGFESQYNTSNWNTIPENADAINPYNQTDPALNNNWYTDDQYKFQPGTNVLGGTGPNVSYKFTTHETVGNTAFGNQWTVHGSEVRSSAGVGGTYVMNTTPDADINNDTKYNGTNDIKRNTFAGTFNYTLGQEVTLGEEDKNNNAITYPVGIGENWQNMASPFVQALFTGYSAGEVYRFGITFRDLKGNPSYVIWIGDIKFPERYDEGFELTKAVTSSPTYGWVNCNQLGIEFTIDISSIKSQISGFEIVRVERRETDKTRLGTGVMTLWEDYRSFPGGVGPQDDNYQILRSGWERQYGIARAASNSTFNFQGDTIQQDASYFNSWIRPADVPGIAITGREGAERRKRSLCTLHSPLKLMDPNYSFRVNDHLKTIGYFAALPSCSENIVSGTTNDNSWPIGTGANIMRHSDYYMCKHFIGITNPWLNSSLDSFQDVGFTGKFFPLTGCLRIRAEQTLGSVEFQKISSANGQGQFFGSTAWDFNSPNYVPSSGNWIGNTGPTINIGTNYGPSGINSRDDIMTFGAKKHILMLNETADNSDWWWGSEEMKYFGYEWYNYGRSVSVSPGFYTDAVQRAEVHKNNIPSPFIPGLVKKLGGKYGEYWNYFKVVSYDRFLPNQYGGADYANRQLSIYQSTGNFQVIGEKSTTTKTFKVFGGDIYVNYYDDEYLPPAISESQETNTSFPKQSIGASSDGLWKEPGASGTAITFPCETPVNNELRAKKHWAADRWTDNWTRMQTMLNQDLDLLSLVMQENNAQDWYLAKDAIANYSEEHSHQIKVSEKKVDGELTDSWSNFLPANTTEVEGVHGPINKMINFQGNVIFFQDSASGSLPIDERALQTTGGADLVLGTGQVINQYKYISNISGTIHQHSVVNTGSTVMYWDDLNKKIYMLGGASGVSAFSDIKGMSSYFPTLDGYMNTGDKTLTRLSPGSYGVHGTYDIRNQRVLMTFLNSKKILEIQPNTQYYPGDVITFGTSFPPHYEASEIIVTGDPVINPDVDPRWVRLIGKDGEDLFQNGLTISINELIQGFESFLDYKPRIYFDTGRRLLSENYDASTEIWEHNKGDWGKFYDKAFDSEITLILNPTADYATVFHNLEIDSEVSINDVDQFESTITGMELWNDYQRTGLIPLVVNDNIKRRMRKWRISLPRDQEGARLRNAYVFLRLKMLNQNDKRLVLHDIILHSTPTNG